MKVLTINKDMIRENIRLIRTEAECPHIIAVLKANAYGLDMRQMAALLQEEEVRRFAVTDPEDAIRLRNWGFGEEEILVLRSTADEGDIRLILEACATATIGSYDAAIALNGIAEEQGLLCDVHLKVDTGMGRYGFLPTELERMISVFRYMPNLHITGMYTHYANAFHNKKKTAAQLALFEDVVARIREAGFSPGLLHASNSAAVFYGRLPSLDAIRIGSAIGGRMTARGDYGLQKVGQLESTVIEVRWLPKGHPVGYGGAFVTKKPTKVAILPVGTSDGFMMEKARDSFRFKDVLLYCGSSIKNLLRRKRFYVHINGKRARILGHVGISHTAVDVTKLDVQPGAPCVLEVSPSCVPEGIERRYD